MTYVLIDLQACESPVSPLFIEGLVLAANFTTQPLDPDTWLSSLFPEVQAEWNQRVQNHLQWQYQALKANQYPLLELLVANADSTEQGLAELASGFMALWPTIEEHWAQVNCTDGALRMLQALLTTLMLALDESATQNSMREAGIEHPPQLSDFIDQLDLMVQEVAMAADEALLGAKAQSVNPFKEVGRNDLCPCGSGKKFKQCCAR
ncbi:SEC-C domain-containing protein [Vibrio tritonius]|uniref:SEC-C domain-containing protein n=1 Tax=Vibrio tritonius TaxID=1435069 RepID=A0ABS7YNI6_9VIBR|nr:SEC-C metal-binding domain-containing protein [Vibrio tritonius]MCA2016537.1 SEC-C domain-containing protein [Vibrio tritonius]